jgi:putative NADH-flavin reductase
MKVVAAAYGTCHAEGTDTVHRARQQMCRLYQGANSGTVRRYVRAGGMGSLGTAKYSWTGLVVRRPHVQYHVCT